MSYADMPGPGQAGTDGPDDTSPPTPSDFSKIPAWLDQVGEGWHPVLIALHQDLMALDPQYSVGQVKEKFGGLRVYLDTGVTPEIEQAINAAEAICWQTCENCAAPGVVRNVTQFYLKTLCDDCLVREAAFRAQRRRDLQQDA